MDTATLPGVYLDFYTTCLVCNNFHLKIRQSTVIHEWFNTFKQILSDLWFHSNIFKNNNSKRMHDNTRKTPKHSEQAWTKVDFSNLGLGHEVIGDPPTYVSRCSERYIYIYNHLCFKHVRSHNVMSCHFIIDHNCAELLQIWFPHQCTSCCQLSVLLSIHSAITHLDRFCKVLPRYGGFHDAMGVPLLLAGWFLWGKSPSINGWWLGVPLFMETSIISIFEGKKPCEDMQNFNGISVKQNPRINGLDETRWNHQPEGWNLAQCLPSMRLGGDCNTRCPNTSCQDCWAFGKNTSSG